MLLVLFLIHLVDKNIINEDDDRLIQIFTDLCSLGPENAAGAFVSHKGITVMAVL